MNISKNITKTPNWMAIFIVMATFFVISFITNVFGAIMPALVEDFSVGLAMAGILTSSFFAAYGIMSIPAGVLVEKLGEKQVLLLAFVMSFIGTASFAAFPGYLTAAFSVFVIGAGFAIMQVTINPLLRVAGGEQHFAVYSVVAQLIFGAAGMLSPLVYSHLVQRLNSGETSAINDMLSAVTPAALPWVSVYWVFTLLCLAMLAIIAVIKLPKVDKNTEEQVESLSIYKGLLKNKMVLLYFAAIAAYVGVEQGVANSTSLFLQQYHGVDAAVEGAGVVSDFWLYLSAGCILGVLMLKLLDSRWVLKVFSLGAMCCLTLAITASLPIAKVAFPMVGFCLSVMFSIIMSLALNSVKSHHGAFSGILCTGIVGGGIVYPIVGLVADFTTSLKLGMLVIYLPLLFIFSIGFWAKPLVNNKTIQIRKSTPTIVSN